MAMKKKFVLRFAVTQIFFIFDDVLEVTTKKYFFRDTSQEI